MCDVVIHRVGFRLGRRHRDLRLFGIVEEVVAALESLVESWNPPGGEDLYTWIDSEEGELEAHLVVALAGAAMRDEVAGLLLGNAHLGSCNDLACLSPVPMWYLLPRAWLTGRAKLVPSRYRDS